METSTISRIKRIASKFTEDRLLSTGTVLEVRPWPDAGITEIDLHLPMINMREWQDVPYIKFRVGPFIYRDYTPFGWDAETSTCSLLVDTGHDGPGSNWAKQLEKGAPIQYWVVDFTRQSPHPTDLVIGLGDSSSLAHLLALQQLTLPKSRFDGAVLVNDDRQADLLREYFGPFLKPLQSAGQLFNWLSEQNYCTAHSNFYITGGNKLVSSLRRQLRGAGHQQMRVKGFWE